ncbi:MAG: NRDE family protein [Gammaproteobacteria bacterium]
MCLILFSLQQNDAYPLVVIANRDEYYARPTQTAHWWPDTPGIFAGRDLTARGTWMGVNKNGRFAAVTNVREPGSFGPARLSRGKLTRDFLSSRAPAETFLKSIESSADDYAGFNLLVGDSSGLYFYSNRHPAIRCIPPGIYGISNGMFDEHWPKLENGKQALADALQQGIDDDILMQILTDDAPANDNALPKTGVSLDIERLLSSRFIRSPDYGTRACSVVRFSRDNQISFVEQNFVNSEKIGILIKEKFQINGVD